jgi:hypothetical protein
MRPESMSAMASAVERGDQGAVVEINAAMSPCRSERRR